MSTSRSRRLRFLVPLVVAALSVLAVSLWARTAPAPPLGLVDGRLRPCPDRPNCVCTGSTDPRQRMEPVPIDSADRARARLETILSDEPRVRIVVAEPGYIAAEFRSLVLGFVDDVEFHLDADAGLLHFRSASRRGYSDLGVNRRRMERIVARLAAANG